jgi:RNA polymerase sigma-70 factor (ECF subfamily)
MSESPTVAGPNPLTFEEFVAVEFEVVVAMALAVLGSRDEAVEVAQETMLRAYQHWPRIGAFDRPGAWTRRVALNLIHDRRRGRSRRRRLLARLTSVRDQEVAAVAADEDSDLWTAVASLSRRRCNIVVLHYVLDLSVAEIARTLEVPEGTVKADLSRARRQLRDRLTGAANDGH